MTNGVASLARVRACYAEVRDAEMAARAARLDYYRAVAALHEGEGGLTYEQIADVLNLSPSRAAQLVKAGKLAEQATDE